MVIATRANCLHLYKNYLVFRFFFYFCFRHQYLSGFISKPDTVLVDIGTGYFVEKHIDAARAFLKKRVDMIQGNASKVHDLIKRKEQMLQDTQVAFQQKLK